MAERRKPAANLLRDFLTIMRPSAGQKVTLGPAALAAGLQQLPRRGPYVFHGCDPSKPLTSIKRVLATASDRATIVCEGRKLHVTPQLPGKAFATWQAQAGTAPKTLQRLLGHAPGSRVTDRYYVQEDEEAKRRAITPLPLGRRRDLHAVRGELGNELATGLLPSAANDG